MAEKPNGSLWRWTTAVGLMIIMFLLGIMAGDGLAAYRVGRNLEEHETGGPHPEQQVWNGRMELRMDVNETALDHAVEILEEVRDAVVRIEAQLGIGR